MMWQKRIGYYDGGICCVELVAREGTGGEFWTRPGKGCVPRVKIGFDYEDFGDVADILFHELMEYTLTARGHRYTESPELSGDMGCFEFVFNHTELSECARIMSGVIIEALPAMMVIHKARKKQVLKAEGAKRKKK